MRNLIPYQDEHILATHYRTFCFKFADQEEHNIILYSAQMIPLMIIKKTVQDYKSDDIIFKRKFIKHFTYSGSNSDKVDFIEQQRIIFQMMRESGTERREIVIQALTALACKDFDEASYLNFAIQSQQKSFIKYKGQTKFGKEYNNVTDYDSRQMNKQQITVLLDEFNATQKEENLGKWTQSIISKTCVTQRGKSVTSRIGSRRSISTTPNITSCQKKEDKSIICDDVLNAPRGIDMPTEISMSQNLVNKQREKTRTDIVLNLNYLREL